MQVWPLFPSAPRADKGAAAPPLALRKEAVAFANPPVKLLTGYRIPTFLLQDPTPRKHSCMGHAVSACVMHTCGVAPGPMCERKERRKPEHERGSRPAGVGRGATSQHGSGGRMLQVSWAAVSSVALMGLLLGERPPGCVRDGQQLEWPVLLHTSQEKRPSGGCKGPPLG